MEEIIKELNRIQKELKAPKGQKNTFGNYKYRSYEDILEAVKPLLGDSVLIVSDELVQIGERYYVKATATLTLNGESAIKAHAYARECLTKKGMDESQITGSASSYARKYALNGLFCIDDTKDADTRDNSDPGPQEKTIKEQIIDIAKKKFESEDAFMVWRVDNGLAEDLKRAGFVEAKKVLDKLKEKK